MFCQFYYLCCCVSIEIYNAGKTVIWTSQFSAPAKAQPLGITVNYTILSYNWIQSVTFQIKRYSFFISCTIHKGNIEVID